MQRQELTDEQYQRILWELCKQEYDGNDKLLARNINLFELGMLEVQDKNEKSNL